MLKVIVSFLTATIFIATPAYAAETMKHQTHINQRGHATSTKDAYRDTLKNSVFKIYAVSKDKESVLGIGNAVAISKHFMVTNCHVAMSGNFIIAQINENPYLARLCYFNQEDDFCIISVSKVNLTPVHIRASSTIKVGENVYAVLAHKGGGVKVLKGRVTDLITKNQQTLIETNFLLAPGTSGGGLFDEDGFFTGIISGGKPNQHVTYAISTEHIMDVIDPKHLPACNLPY